jgi:hypothetical protein
MTGRKWYYVESGQQKGPVSENTIMELLEKKIIPLDTWLWSEGMSDWRPASEVFEVKVPSKSVSLSKDQEIIEQPEQSLAIKKTPVILTIIFTLITIGIYLPCWFLTRRRQINSLQSQNEDR